MKSTFGRRVSVCSGQLARRNARGVRILSAETVATPVTGNWNIDTECCYWDNNQLQNNPFVNIIRIYFEYGSPKHETLAFEDFVPSRDLWDSPLAVPNYEPFASVLKRASQWVQQQSVNFLSCQSIDVPLHNNWSTNDKQIESKNMFFEKPTNDFVLKFIRIAHIISKNVSQNEKTNLLLNCKIFVPSKSATTGEYEDCLTVKRKMETWLTTTGARILSAETTVIKLSYATSSVAAAVDSMFTSLSSGAVGSHWITIYRIYIDGQYLEPPFRLLPPIVDLEANDDSSCTLS
ncbi:hypothetical protein B4U79_14841 [Dinothrombium tinctorium]|uniref:Uncharacterized protein n=1 Tax=Dinothrombium tinctorium TaxID=1965070 RepID=A0A3S3QM14_9ACAR|nr:hypothetical protein B4U79_14841 [Dinothrombium tinctorium]